MAYVNFQRSYVRFKIVYCGPGLSGKTTNLEELHRLAGDQGEVVTLESEGDRTISVDHRPLDRSHLGGLETVFELSTAPGPVRHNRTHRMVLRDADGVVFVADSQTAALAANVASLADLRKNLAADGVDLDALPLVFQYNKRDLEDVATTAELEQALNPGGRRSFAAAALTGRNVRETFAEVARQIYEGAAAQYSVVLRDPAVVGEPASPSAWTAAQEEPEEPRGAGPEAAEPMSRERSGLDSWQAVDRVVPADRRVTLTPGRRGATETLPPEPPPAAAASALERALDQLRQEIEGQREVLQQLALTPGDQGARDELERVVGGLRDEIGDQLERNRHYFSALIETIGRVGDEIRGLRAEITQEIKVEVDRYLAAYLLEVEQGIQAMPVPASAGRGDHGGGRAARRDSQPIGVIRPTPLPLRRED